MNTLHVKSLSLLVAAGILSSCASMPDVEVTYYLPKADVKIDVTQTISCKKLTSPLVVTSVEFTDKYSANRDHPYIIDYDSLDTFYSRADAKATLTSDGRISAFNSTSTGGGTEIVDTIISIYGREKNAQGDTPIGDIIQACELIKELAGHTDTEPKYSLTVKLTSDVEFNKTSIGKKDLSAFTLEGYHAGVYAGIAPALGAISIRYEDKDAKKVTEDELVENKQSITVTEPASINLIVEWSATNGANTTYKHNLLVPQLGGKYQLPIPNPPLFGTNELELSLHESGKVQSLKYGTKDGVSSAASALSKINSEFDNDKTSAEKANELKAESDIVYQQQRQIICQETPADCPK